MTSFDIFKTPYLGNYEGNLVFNSGFGATPVSDNSTLRVFVLKDRIRIKTSDPDGVSTDGIDITINKVDADFTESIPNRRYAILGTTPVTIAGDPHVVGFAFSTPNTAPPYAEVQIINTGTLVSYIYAATMIPPEEPAVEIETSSLTENILTISAILLGLLLVLSGIALILFLFIKYR